MRKGKDPQGDPTNLRTKYSEYTDRKTTKIQ
jgi:hypothetical protein